MTLTYKQRSCTSKKQYLDEPTAAHMARNINERRRERKQRRREARQDTALQAYQCRFCGLWHIGHRNPEATS